MSERIKATTEETIAALERMPVTISVSVAARKIGVTPARLRAAIERGEVPFAVDITVPGEEKGRYRVYTQRLIGWLRGEC